MPEKFTYIPNNYMLLKNALLILKSEVSMEKICQFYGININRSNKALCPFHDDVHNSMHIYSNNFYQSFPFGGGPSIRLSYIPTHAPTYPSTSSCNSSFLIPTVLWAPCRDRSRERALASSERDWYLLFSFPHIHTMCVAQSPDTQLPP